MKLPAKLKLNLPIFTIGTLTIDTKNLILPAISIIFGVILLITLLIPQTIDFFKMQSVIIDLQDQAANLDAKSKVLETISIQNYQTELSTTLKALPAERDYIITTALLQSLAANSKVSLVNVNFNDNPSGYEIKVQINGQLDQVKDFILKVNSAPRVMKIQSIDLTPDKNTYNASISIKAILAPISKENIQLEQPVEELTSADQAKIDQLAQSLSQLTNLGSSSSGTQRFNSRTDPF